MAPQKCCTPEGQIKRYVDCIGCDRRPDNRIDMAQEIKITQTSNADMNIGVPKPLTAVDWLEIQVRNFNDRKQTHYEYDQMFIQAKQMEMEQIAETYRVGVEEDIYNNPLRTGKEYYNDIYKK